MKEKVKEIVKETARLLYQKIKSQKNIRLIGILCVFFMVCSFISRGIYSANLPQVSIGHGKIMSLEHRVEVDGEVTGNKEIAVAAEPNLLISSLLVEPGQQVEKETPLLQIDLHDLKNKIEKQETEIQKAKLNIQELEQNESIANKQKATDKSRAQEDYNNAKKSTKTNNQNAKNNLEKAQNALDGLGSKKEYINKLKEQDPEFLALKKSVERLKKEYQTLKDNLASQQDLNDKNNALQEAEIALENYEMKLEQTLGLEWEAKKESLKQEVENSKAAVQASKVDGKSSLQGASRAVSDASTNTAVNSGLAIAKIELEESEKQLERYKKLQESNGIVSSSLEGDIVKIYAETGTLTGEGAVMTMTDKTDGYRFSAKITKKEKKYVELNDGATVKLVNGDIADIVIDAMEEDTETKQYQISGVIDQDVNLGNIGKLSIEKMGEQKGFCVPLQAVHGSMGDYYILAVERRQTILGEQLQAIKYPVTLNDQNDVYAEIKGSVSEEQEIIVFSTKNIYEGDTVRLLEN